MKKGFYIRLAGEGISKNRKLYFPYILTCICMIMMYYIVSFLSISKELASIRGGEMLQGLLSMGVFVVAVFALIFLYYTNSFLIRKRKKELGLYNILGMGKRNLVRILFVGKYTDCRDFSGYRNRVRNSVLKTCGTSGN